MNMTPTTFSEAEGLIFSMNAWLTGARTSGESPAPLRVTPDARPRLSGNHFAETVLAVM